MRTVKTHFFKFAKQVAYISKVTFTTNPAAKPPTQEVSPT
jgi:hypothetical protein